MKKRSTLSSRRRLTERPGQRPHSNPLLPTEIPGVRIAYIGHDTGAVDYMRTYWQARRASFQQLTLTGERSADGLERLLEWADIVLHSEDGIAAPLWRRIEVYCDRAEKPLIGIDQHRVSGLAEALTGWCPLRCSHS